MAKGKKKSKPSELSRVEVNPVIRNDDPKVKEYLVKLHHGQVIEYVTGMLESALMEVEVPSPVVAQGRIWSQTGTWVIEKFEVKTYMLRIKLHVLWMTAMGDPEVCPNPFGAAGPVANFGPKFVLPFPLEGEFQFKRPYSIPGDDEIPSEQLGIFSEQLRAAIEKLSSIKKL